MTPVLTAADVLGEKIWDALEAANRPSAPQGAGRDGFDILRDPTTDDHVVIIYRREGPMFGIGGNAATRKHLDCYRRDLDEAGYEARLHEVGPTAVCVVAALTSDAADQGLAALVTYAATVNASAKEATG